MKEQFKIGEMIGAENLTIPKDIEINVFVRKDNKEELREMKNKEQCVVVPIMRYVQLIEKEKMYDGIMKEKEAAQIKVQENISRCISNIADLVKKESDRRCIARD